MEPMKGKGNTNASLQVKSEKNIYLKTQKVPNHQSINVKMKFRNSDQVIM